jgi:hypothetical protein
MLGSGFEVRFSQFPHACLPGRAHTGGMTDRDEFLAWVKTDLYEAELALHNGDSGPRLLAAMKNCP